MSEDKRPQSVATIRLPRSERDHVVLLHHVRHICIEMPRAVVTVRREGQRGLLLVSRNQTWCFETTSTRHRDWMERCARHIAAPFGVGGDGRPVVVTLLGQVEGQEALWEA